MKKYILFICGHNSGRSQMAEVYFNFYNKNPDIEAFSAGTNIKGDGKINPKIVELLKNKGIDIFNQPKKYFPKMVETKLIKNALYIYTMGCMKGGCINGIRKVDFDFGLDDPANIETNIDDMWRDFEMKIKPILQKFN